MAWPLVSFSTPVQSWRVRVKTSWQSLDLHITVSTQLRHSIRTCRGPLLVNAAVLITCHCRKEHGREINYTYALYNQISGKVLG